jgi:hypothetical protein
MIKCSHVCYASVNNRANNDQVVFSFDLTAGNAGVHVFHALNTYFMVADISPAWNWNSRVVFAYIVAEYQSTSNVSVSHL